MKINYLPEVSNMLLFIAKEVHFNSLSLQYVSILPIHFIIVRPPLRDLGVPSGKMGNSG